MLRKLILVLGALACVAMPAKAQIGTINNPAIAILTAQDSGTCSAANGSLVQQLPVNAGTTTVTLAGTFSATVTIRRSNNGGATWATANTVSATGTTSYSTSGYTHLCADVTSYTSGAVSVAISTGTGGGGGAQAVTTVSGLSAFSAKGNIAVVTDGSTGTDCTVGGGSTLVACLYNGSTWGQLPAASAGATAFSAITGATNAAALVMGTGGSLSTSGSGTIDSTTLLTKTWAIPGTIGSTTPNTGAFSTLSATGHVTFEGVTSTGATGTGNLVFSASPTFTGTMNTANISLTGLLTTAASAAGGAGFNLPPGTAPTAPNNGDLWTTTAGLFAQINGATVGPFGTGAGGGNVSTSGSPLNHQYAIFSPDSTHITGVTPGTAGLPLVSNGISADPSAQALPVASVVPSANNGDNLCTTSGAAAWCTPGITINSITGTTYTVAAADRGDRDQFTGTAASAWTLPQAGSTGFANNYFFTVPNFSANNVNVTLTPTTSKCNGGANCIIGQGQVAYVTSNNTDYFAHIGWNTLAGGSFVTITPNQFGGTVDLTAAVPISLGGTGQTTQQAGFNALAPTPTRAGDITYYNGTNYVNLAGNNSGTNCFEENASGVPSFTSCGSAPALSAITAAAGSNTLANGNNPQIWNWALTTSSTNGMTFGETTAATGSSESVVGINTLSTSTAQPLTITQGSGASGAVPPNPLGITFGAGGAAATVTSAGNAGASLSWTAGAGSAGGATSGTGGTGGSYTFTAGAGGNATAGSTNGTGGSVTIASGACGTGGSGCTNGSVTLNSGGGSLSVDGAGNIKLNPTSGSFATVTALGAGAFQALGSATAADIPMRCKYGLAAPTGDCFQESSSGGSSLFSLGPNGIVHDGGTQLITAADYTNSTVTPSTLFSWTLPPTAAARTYRYSCSITWESTNTTLVGPVFGINLSAAPTQLTGTGYVKSALNSTTNAEAEGYLSNTTTGSQTLVTGNAAAITSTNYEARIWGTIEGAAVAGSTFIINAASTSGTTATLNIRRGSSCVMTSSN